MPFYDPSAGDRLMDGEGKLRLDAEGRLALRDLIYDGSGAANGDSICCCPCPCVTCPDTPPRWFTVVISGVTVCDCYAAGLLAVKMPEGFDPNGTYVLTCQMGGAETDPAFGFCRWYYSEPGTSASMSEGDSPTCDDAPNYCGGNRWVVDLFYMGDKGPEIMNGQFGFVAGFGGLLPVLGSGCFDIVCDTAAIICDGGGIDSPTTCNPETLPIVNRYPDFSCAGGGTAGGGGGTITPGPPTQWPPLPPGPLPWPPPTDPYDPTEPPPWWPPPDPDDPQWPVKPPRNLWPPFPWPPGDPPPRPPWIPTPWIPYPPQDPPPDPDPDPPGSNALVVVDCDDQTIHLGTVLKTAGVLGKILPLSGGVCGRVSAIQANDGGTITPTEYVETCEWCRLLNQYSLLTPCDFTGSDNLWCKVSDWVTSGHHGFLVDGHCYTVSASSERKTEAEVTALGGTIVDAPTFEDCDDASCPKCHFLYASVYSCSSSSFSTPTLAGHGCGNQWDLLPGEWGLTDQVVGGDCTYSIVVVGNHCAGDCTDEVGIPDPPTSGTDCDCPAATPCSFPGAPPLATSYHVECDLCTGVPGDPTTHVVWRHLSETLVWDGGEAYISTTHGEFGTGNIQFMACAGWRYFVGNHELSGSCSPNFKAGGATPAGGTYALPPDPVACIFGKDVVIT